MMRIQNKCILFFVRYPEPGKVKTRLAKGIGNDNAAELYRRFLLDIRDVLVTLGYDIIVCFTPREAGNRVETLLNIPGRYIPQEGNGLGERLNSAFLSAFEGGYDRVVVIGSDSPDLPVSYIFQAFDSLGHSHAVIGPSTDGGYYLLGFRRETFLPGIFKDIPWSTNAVFAQTMKKLEVAHYLVGRLREWHDIDTLSDLQHLFRENSKGAFASSRTMTFLAGLRVKEGYNFL